MKLLFVTIALLVGIIGCSESEADISLNEEQMKKTIQYCIGLEHIIESFGPTFIETKTAKSYFSLKIYTLHSQDPVVVKGEASFRQDVLGAWYFLNIEGSISSFKFIDRCKKSFPLVVKNYDIDLNAQISAMIDDLKKKNYEAFIRKISRPNELRKFEKEDKDKLQKFFKNIAKTGEMDLFLKVLEYVQGKTPNIFNNRYTFDLRKMEGTQKIDKIVFSYDEENSRFYILKF